MQVQNVNSQQSFAAKVKFTQVIKDKGIQCFLQQSTISAEKEAGWRTDNVLSMLGSRLRIKKPKIVAISSPTNTYPLGGWLDYVFKHYKDIIILRSGKKQLMETRQATITIQHGKNASKGTTEITRDDSWKDPLFDEIEASLKASIPKKQSSIFAQSLKNSVPTRGSK